MQYGTFYRQLRLYRVPLKIFRAGLTQFNEFMSLYFTGDNVLKEETIRIPIDTKSFRSSEAIEGDLDSTIYAHSSSSALSVETSSEVLRKVSHLAHSFFDITTDIEEYLEEHQPKPKKFAKFASRYQNKDSEHTSSVEDILHSLKKGLCYVEPKMDLLFGLDQLFCNEHFAERLQKYDADVEKFLNSTPIKEFASSIRKKEIPLEEVMKKDPEAKIVVRVKGRYSAEMISYIKKLRKSLFKDRSFDVSLIDVRQSILTLEYSVSTNLVTDIITIIEKGKQSLQQLGVLSVQIGENNPIEIQVESDESLDQFLKGILNYNYVV